MTAVIIIISYIVLGMLCGFIMSIFIDIVDRSDIFMLFVYSILWPMLFIGQLVYVFYCIGLRIKKHINK